VAAGRSIEKLADFADQGVRVTAMDYDDPASVASAIAGARKVLLIASSEVGKDRAGQHRTVIEAAKAAEGVELIAYTSTVNAERNETLLGENRKATEAILADAGVPFALLRNGYSFENWTDQIQGMLAQGALVGSAGDGGSAPPPAPTSQKPPRLCSSPTTRRARSTSSEVTTRSR
jgi:NAD(P)H dehydrogenase (quinone)